MKGIAEFVIEGTQNDPLFSFILNGKKHPKQHTIDELPIPGNFDATVEQYKELFPEDEVIITDKRPELTAA